MRKEETDIVGKPMWDGQYLEFWKWEKKIT